MPKKKANAACRYAGYPTAVVYDKPTTKGRKAVKQLLWGDWMTVTGRAVDGYLPVHARGCDGFIAKKETMPSRLLEIVFVDIGQGDGCLLVTPDDKHILVDAGAGDNMSRFLRWRYGRFVKDFVFEAAVMSHSDLDHYGGFAKLFGEAKVRFKRVYTNGLMERVAGGKKEETLGKPRKNGDLSYIVDLVTDLPALRSFTSKASNVRGKTYPTMFKKALAANKFDDFRMVSAADRYLPGFGRRNPVTIEVLGPVTEDLNGRPALRWFGDVGKTKNGHSVVLRLKYGNVTVLLGGDLNIPSEGLLLTHHTRTDRLPEKEDERQALGVKARGVFQVDFAKSCHHGSADFSRAFLAAVNPIATVISSGDDEAYSHPRADALGTIGRYSRGIRPLIFSTELARSAPERIKHPAALRKRVDLLMDMARDAKTKAARDELTKKADELKANLDRSVAVYGAINLRTDGKRVVVAQKIEKARGENKEWDVYAFERDRASRELAYVSKFEGDGADAE